VAPTLASFDQARIAEEAPNCIFLLRRARWKVESPEKTIDREIAAATRVRRGSR
jgi:hypothetical protein